MSVASITELAGQIHGTLNGPGKSPSAPPTASLATPPAAALARPPAYAGPAKVVNDGSVDNAFVDLLSDLETLAEAKRVSLSMQAVDAASDDEAVAKVLVARRIKQELLGVRGRVEDAWGEWERIKASLQDDVILDTAVRYLPQDADEPSVGEREIAGIAPEFTLPQEREDVTAVVDPTEVPDAEATFRGGNGDARAAGPGVVLPQAGNPAAGQAAPPATGEDGHRVPVAAGPRVAAGEPLARDKRGRVILEPLKLLTLEALLKHGEWASLSAVKRHFEQNAGEEAVRYLNSNSGRNALRDQLIKEHLMVRAGDKWCITAEGRRWVQEYRKAH